MADILILDDNAGDGHFLTTALQQSGHCVLHVEELSRAREIVAQAVFDLFLLDVRYVHGHALDLIPLIRDRKGDTGIIVLTSRDDEGDRVLALEIGADDCLVKPVGAREIQARAKALLRRVARPVTVGAASGFAEPAGVPFRPGIAFHGFVLDVASRTVTDQGTNTPVSLTNMEFDVLSALAQNRNRVMSRKEIETLVRGRDWSSDDRAIDVVISRLRRKLYGDRTGAQRIKTVRGVGYMLSVAK